MDVDAELESTLKEPKPCDVLWLHDGNIILETDTHLFKVHKTVLSMQSSVFKDMFDLPTVGGTQTTLDGTGRTPDMYEGLEVVKLVGDRGKDVVHLLRAAYERQYYRVDRDDTPLEVITALLLLSTKYDFKHIRRDVIAHISKHFQMDLDACDAMEEDDETLIFVNPNAISRFALLKALHTANVDVLLPSAYYACAEYLMRILKENANFLGLECSTTLMAGKFELGYEINELIAKVPHELILEAGIPGNCTHGIVVAGLSENINTPDMKSLEGTIVVGNCLSDLCHTCELKMVNLINVKRQEIWDKVPGYFGFSAGWDVLKAKLDEILSSDT